MKSLRSKLVGLIVCVPALILLTAPAASAGSVAYVPYTGYEYNSFTESVPAPIGYEAAAQLSGTDLGTLPLESPRDMCFSSDGDLYILSEGNEEAGGRIDILGEDLRLKKSLSAFDYQGETLTITGAQGLFVCDDGTLLVADTANQRVLVADGDGRVEQILRKPDTGLISDTQVFEPTKVMRDGNGITYVLVKGFIEGAVTYKPDGTFGGFFASNEVERTAEVILDYIWEMFMTDSQIQATRRRAPSEFTNFDIDGDGLIYTVTGTAGAEGNVRKLNFKGDNILKEEDYGDFEWDRQIKESLTVETRMTDIDVDADGYMVMLDAARGRIFEYTPEGVLVTVAGGLGEQVGLFESPVAVETRGGRIFVLDNMYSSLTIFEPTAYTAAFKQAFNRYLEGDYTGSLEYWAQVLSMNSNSEWACYGIGQALTENEQYAESLPYFRRAYSTQGYSDSFREVRTDFIRQHFVWLVLGAAAAVVLAAVGIRLLVRRFRRQNLYTRSVLETTYTYPLYTAIHPFDGFGELKQHNRWSVKAGAAILVVLFFTLCAQWFFTGFTFAGWRLSDFNVLITITQAFLILLVWTLSNWAVCTLIEGKGRLREIFCMSAYALVPFVIGTLLVLLLSNVLVEEEGVFLTIIQQVGIWWSAAVLLAGLSSIHQFGFGKTLLSVLLTLIGIVIIIFLLILFFGLLKQVVDFVISIVNEIRMMM